MKKWLLASISFTTVSLFLCISSAQGQAVELEHEGQLGIWFPAEMARLVQADVEELRILKPRITLMEGQLQLRLERIENLQEAERLSRERTEATVAALDNSIRLQREAEEERDAWYRSPYLWTTVGVVVGATVLALSAHVMGKVSGD